MPYQPAYVSHVSTSEPETQQEGLSGAVTCLLVAQETAVGRCLGLARIVEKSGELPERVVRRESGRRIQRAQAVVP